ncbi:uncharacterized protein LOC128953098 [Oppia nitens]|uniref:uncharacterized protein LOC128953098 n=1 Tax=Oppia nitens TaxID=1686743 RepID=UPI0023DBC731|nr:uncharacterized protein LOC128953098 [Oppia nitens]
MLNLLFFIVVVIGNCFADDNDYTSNKSDENLRKFRKQFCVPKRTDNEIVKKIIDCENKAMNGSTNDFKLLKVKLDKIGEQCGQGLDTEIAAYSKVDLKNDQAKQLLLAECSPKHETCYNNELNNNKLLVEDLRKISNEYYAAFKCYVDCALKVVNV